MEALRRLQEVGLPDDGVSGFINARSRILAVAFRTLGNAADAEDIVQDVWLRWQNIDRTVVQNPRAFLTMAAKRLAINRVTGARMRHEMTPEFPLPEPVDQALGPAILAERSQSLESALLQLLEKLSPTERAAYLLREAFDYSYEQISKIVRVSEANGRQLVTRARKHLADERRVSVAAIELRRLAAAVNAATRRGDLAGLEATLWADIVGSRASNSDSRRRACARRLAA
jgi:RNA polymerase sigma-70 factor (ECF subfamily)